MKIIKCSLPFPSLSILSLILRWVANSWWSVLPSWIPLKTAENYAGMPAPQYEYMTDCIPAGEMCVHYAVTSTMA